MRVTLAAIVAASMLSGCADHSGGEPDGGNFPVLTPEEADREYADEASKWELPAGWSYRDGRIYPAAGPDGGGEVFEPGIGRVDATFYWFCAWSRTLLAAETEPERESALEQVGRLSETAFYQIGLDPRGRDRFDSMVDAAQAGDYQPLRESVELNCPESSY